MADQDYRTLVAKVSSALPRVGAALVSANAAREWSLRGYADGVRLRGLEQLYEYLEKAEHLLAESSWGRDIAFLVRRVRVDFDLALESTLSGHVSGAFEAMRDVLEIELLLRDFTTSPDHAKEWLEASERERWKRFGPSELRKRQRNEGHVWSESDESAYRGHSRALHVTPSPTPFGTKTSHTSILFGVDTGFWDMFDHARRTVVVLDGLLTKRQIGPKPVSDPNLDLPALKSGWACTLHINRIFTALLENPPTAADRDTLEAINHLPFVFDKLHAEGDESGDTQGHTGGPTPRCTPTAAGGTMSGRG